MKGMMDNKKKSRCLWCGSTETFTLGASGFLVWKHCMGCAADYQVDMGEYAWKDNELKKQENG